MNMSVNTAAVTTKCHLSVRSHAVLKAAALPAGCLSGTTPHAAQSMRSGTVHSSLNTLLPDSLMLGCKSTPRRFWDWLEGRAVDFLKCGRDLILFYCLSQKKMDVWTKIRQTEPLFRRLWTGNLSLTLFRFCGKLWECESILICPALKSQKKD